MFVIDRIENGIAIIEYIPLARIIEPNVVGTVDVAPTPSKRFAGPHFGSLQNENQVSCKNNRL